MERWKEVEYSRVHQLCIKKTESTSNSCISNWTEKDETWKNIWCYELSLEEGAYSARVSEEECSSE